MDLVVNFRCPAGSRARSTRILLLLASRFRVAQAAQEKKNGVPGDDGRSMYAGPFATAGIRIPKLPWHAAFLHKA